MCGWTLRVLMGWYFWPDRMITIHNTYNIKNLRIPLMYFTISRAFLINKYLNVFHALYRYGIFCLYRNSIIISVLLFSSFRYVTRLVCIGLNYYLIAFRSESRKMRNGKKTFHPKPFFFFRPLNVIHRVA